MHRRKMKARMRHDAGMTLLELMFAAGVLALALSMLFGSLISINVIGRLSEDRAVAASIVGSALEEVRALPLSELLTFVPQAINQPGQEQAISMGYFDADGALVDLPLPAGTPPPANLPNPLEVQATVIWTDDNGRVYSMSATTHHGR